MDLQYIREFTVLAQSPSFRAAAKQLYISQPTLSKHIALLESEVGCNLVERDSAGLRLTSAGRFFLDSSLDLLEYVDDRMRDICDRTRAVESDMTELRVPDFSRVVPRYAEYLLQAKSLLEESHTPLQVEFNSVNLFDPAGFDQMSPLESLLFGEGGGADWFVYIASPSRTSAEVETHFSDKGLSALHISRSSCQLVVEATHPLASKATVTLEDAAAFPFLSNTYPVSYYASYRQAIVDELQSHGVQSPSLVKGAQKHSALNSWGGGQRLGECIAPVPSLAFDFMGFYDQTRNTVLNVADFEMNFDFYLVWNPRSTTREARYFIESLETVIARDKAQAPS